MARGGEDKENKDVEDRDGVRYKQKIKVSGREWMQRGGRER